MRTIIEALTSYDWDTLDPTVECDARLTREHGEERLALEHRHQRRELWLSLGKRTETRTLVLPYGNALEVVVEKIVTIQDQLSVDAYEDNLRDLQRVCDASLLESPSSRKFFSMELRIEDLLRAEGAGAGDPDR